MLIPKDVAHDLLRRTIPYGVGSGWVPEDAGGAGLVARGHRRGGGGGGADPIYQTGGQGLGGGVPVIGAIRQQGQGLLAGRVGMTLRLDGLAAISSSDAVRGLRVMRRRPAFPPQRQDMDNVIPPLIQWDGERAAKPSKASG